MTDLGSPGEPPIDIDSTHRGLMSLDDLNADIRPAYKDLVNVDMPELELKDDMHACPRFRVNSKAFFDWLQRLAEVPSNLSNRSRFYFRGESRASYQLLPTLLRDGVYETLKVSHRATSPIDLQQKLLDRYRRYTQHLIHSDNDFKAPIWDDFDTLCLAQHHGLPTLLMDWTLNPYVAAYFALSGAFKSAVREELSANQQITKYWARVWVMRLKEPKHREVQTVHLENRKVKWDEKLGDAILTPTAPLLVVPLVFTRRIAAQVGRFVYCGHIAKNVYDSPASSGPDKSSGSNGKKFKPQTLCSYDGSREDLCWNQLYSLDIEFDIGEKYAGAETSEKLREFRKKILETMSHLEFTGFHAGRLFPDLEGWARYLAEGNL